MLTTKPVSRTSDNLETVKQIYYKEFPPHEQIPMWFLLWSSKKASANFVSYHDAEDVVGFSYHIVNDDIVFVFFLAVNRDVQSKGYGGKILDHIKAEHPQKKIILDIEIPDEKAENEEQRIRRKNFYLRSGFQETGRILRQTDMDYELLVANGEFDEQELLDLFRLYSGPILYRFFAPQVV